MNYLSWFLLGSLLSALSVVSINRAISVLYEHGSMRIFWVRYVFRLMLAGTGLLLAVQWGVEQILAVFCGLIFFRLLILFPKFTRYFSQSFL